MDIWKALAGAGEEEQEDLGEISLGGGGGGGRKRVGQMLIVPRFQVWVPKGIEPGDNGVTAPSERRDFESGSFMYWPVTQETPASTMQKIVQPDNRFGARHVVLVDMQASSFLNWPEDGGDAKNIVTSVELSKTFPALVAPKNDAEEKRRWRQVAFHLMFLPSIVQSVAVAAGMMAKSLYDYGRLAELEEPTEEVFNTFVGSKEEPGELVVARGAIWSALGEQNIVRWSADAKGRTTNVAPGSQLSAVIKHLLYRVAPEALWCELAPYVQIPDHHAIDKNGRAQLAPVVTKVWQTDAEARVYAKEAYPNSTGSVSGSLPLPAAFRAAGVNEMGFVTHLKGLLAKPVFAGKNAEQIEAWLGTAKGALWIEAEGMESVEAVMPWIAKAL